MTRITDPAAFADQHQAAVSHLDRILDRTGMGMTLGTVEPWLSDRIDDLLKAIDNGQAETCPHLSAGGPSPCFAALWRPGRIACPACTSSLELDQDPRCSRCGTDPGEQIGLRTVQLANLAVLVIECDTCYAPH